MPKLVNATCPRCGAVVPLEDDSDRATCTFCGAVAILSAPPAPPSPMPMPVPAAPRARLTGGFLLGCLLVPFLAVMGAGFAGYFLMRPSGSDPSTPPPSPSVPPIPAMPVSGAPVDVASPPPAAPTPAPTPVETYEAVSGIPIFALDVDGDRRLEIVAPVESTSAPGLHYAVFDATTGARRSMTPVIEDLRSAVPAGIGNRLVVASRDGRLEAWDLVSGDSQWTTMLGERVSSLCAPAAPGTILVETTAARRLALDLTTGRQAETRDACERLLARTGNDPEPRDRRDHSAPPGVEAWQCGSVRVMGSQNFVVPDACAARGRLDAQIEGMFGHRIWKHERGWLVFGVRSPGTYVAMVARTERGRVVWKNEVPADNPLEAAEGGPREVGLVGDTLVVGYDTGRSRSGVVTAFEVGDGTRRWTTRLPGDDALADLVSLDDAVVVRTGDALRIIAAADGAVRATIGSP